MSACERNHLRRRRLFLYTVHVVLGRMLGELKEVESREICNWDVQVIRMHDEHVCELEKEISRVWEGIHELRCSHRDTFEVCI